MKFVLTIAVALSVTLANANTRNCTSREVDGYTDEFEHFGSDDGTPGISYITGSKARSLYLKLRADEVTEDGESYKKSSNTTECSKEEIKELGCAQYTCVIQEFKK